VVGTLGDAFPELKKDPTNVKAKILEEEKQFFKTLHKGEAEFNRRLKN